MCYSAIPDLFFAASYDKQEISEFIKLLTAMAHPPAFFCNRFIFLEILRSKPLVERVN
jgi:hypothetical protein